MSSYSCAFAYVAEFPYGWYEINYVYIHGDGDNNMENDYLS